MFFIIKEASVFQSINTVVPVMEVLPWMLQRVVGEGECLKGADVHLYRG